MSSCLIGGGVMKSPPSSSLSSSTLSESSTSSRQISTKRARTPRKRPNQAYTEAAALLSNIYPKIFSPKNLNKLSNHKTPSFYSFTEASDLLPIFNPPCEKPRFRIKPKLINSLPCNREPDDDIDVESIFDDDVEVGIDSIMGNNGSSNEEPMNIKSLMGFGFGFGFSLSREKMRRALRSVNDWERWSSPRVALSEISSSSSSKKKKKKKKVKEGAKLESLSETMNILTMENLGARLFLKLNHDEVFKDWSDRGSPFSDATDGGGGSLEFSGDILVGQGGENCPVPGGCVRWSRGEGG